MKQGIYYLLEYKNMASRTEQMDRSLTPETNVKKKTNNIKIIKTYDCNHQFFVYSLRKHILPVVFLES
uniref:Uncharacterized protein n=1 Tax=Anguilla anguilla TaxID=7936 RepID=A0A0E9PHQ1_ANGAN